MTEEQMAIALTRYIEVKGRGRVLYHHDFGSGTRLTPSQARRQKALNTRRGHPDLMVYEPRGGYSGLAIELKREGARVLKRDGSPASEHIREQANYLDELRERGWKCFFCVGYEDAVDTIADYLGWSNRVEF